MFDEFGASVSESAAGFRVRGLRLPHKRWTRSALSD